jgi:DNA-directed RNA polymerase specialized sigma24 family protein
MRSSDAAEREQGWALWYQRDGTKLLAYLERRVHTGHSSEQSEDLLQDCFVIGFRNVSSGRYVEQGNSLCAYLYGIARRLLYESARLQKREVSFPQGDDEDVVKQEIELAERVWLSEVLELVKCSCAQKPVLAQRVVAELYSAGKSPDELAHELSKSAGNIRTIAHRTISGIAGDLARQGISLSTQGVRTCLQELYSLDIER